MAQKASSDKEIVAELGVVVLAERLNFTEHAVKKWMQRGIPWKARAAVARVATARGIKLPADFLMRGPQEAVADQPKRRAA